MPRSTHSVKRPVKARKTKVRSTRLFDAQEPPMINDQEKIATLIKQASDSTQLQGAQSVAARKLLDYDGEIFPSDGCAITLSVLLQNAGIAVPDTFMAIELARLLENGRLWQRVPVGQQQAGDIGSTCGTEPHHGTDHVYLVLRKVNNDEMVIADNQAREPHFRYASGVGKTPTRYFLRASE